MRSPLQLVLDLFGAASDAAPPPAAAPVPSKSARPQTPRGKPQQPDRPRPGPPPGPRGDPWGRPQADRQVRLLDQVVAWRLVRARRRSIGMTVGPEGLVVRAPGWVPLREIEAALHEKAGWILAKLQLMRERAALPAAAPQVWGHGAELPFLGRKRVLCLAGHPPPPALQEGEVPGGPEPLHLQLPSGAGVAQVREAAEAWLQQQARAWFTGRLDHFAPRLGVRWQRLSLSSARTRWGSASRDGHIRLNWSLIQLPPAQIDYVVVHELAHLREMNHSPRFWDVVAEVMPDWPAQRQALRQVTLAQEPGDRG